MSPVLSPNILEQLEFWTVRKLWEHLNASRFTDKDRKKPREASDSLVRELRAQLVEAHLLLMKNHDIFYPPSIIAETRGLFPNVIWQESVVAAKAFRIHLKTVRWKQKYKLWFFLGKKEHREDSCATRFGRADGFESNNDQEKLNVVQVLEEIAPASDSSHKINSDCCAREKKHLDVVQMTQENECKKKVSESENSVI